MSSTIGANSLISRYIDTLLDVLRRRLEKFRSVYVVAEENGATDASAACRIDATMPQKPEFLVPFVVNLQKAEPKKRNITITLQTRHISSLTCVAPNAENVRVLATPRPTPKSPVRMRHIQLLATVQRRALCSSPVPTNASKRILLSRDDDENHCLASRVDALRSRIPFCTSPMLSPS